MFQLHHGAALLLALPLVGLACGGSDKVVHTQTENVADDDGDVHQKTTVTTTNADGQVIDQVQHKTQIVDD